MLYKVIVFLIVFVLSEIITYLDKDKKNNIFFITILTLFLSIVFAFREFLFDYYGTDYHNYESWFYMIKFRNLSYFGLTNIGFNMLISITKIISNNFIFFQFICGFIINYLIIDYAKVNSNDFSLSIIIYLAFLLNSVFNVTRQWLACSIFLYSLKYIDKSFIKYSLLCLLGFTFHSSCIFLILLYFILNKNEKIKKKRNIIILTGLIIYLNIDKVTSFIFSSDLFMKDLYSKYINYTIEVNNYIPFIICIVLFILINLLDKSMPETEGKKRIMLYILLASIFSLISAKSFIFARFYLYFFPSIMLGIPLVIKAFDKNSRNILKYILLVFLFIMFVVK